MFTKKTLCLVCTVSHRGCQASEHRTPRTWDGTLPLAPSMVDTSRMNVRTRGPHSPAEPRPPKKNLLDPNLWNRKGPSLSWEITKMGRTSGGIRRRPGSVRLWMHTMEMEGPLVKIIPSMVCFPPVRHERSHIMYWNCGRNRLMSLSNVSRDGRAQSHPCRGSNCQRAPEYFCDVRSVEIANWDWLQEFGGYVLLGADKY